MYTCDTCKRPIRYEEAGSMNPENGEPICRRCAVTSEGRDPDVVAVQLRAMIGEMMIWRSNVGERICELNRLLVGLEVEEPTT